MAIGILSLHLKLPLSKSLKDKRGLLKPLLHRIHKEFNISISEMELQNKRTESIIAISQISNDHKHTQSELHAVIDFIKKHFKDIEILENHIELL